MNTDAPTITRTCPHCAAQSTEPGTKCPHCGKKYKKRSAAKTFLLVLTGLFILGMGGCALMIAGIGAAVDEATEAGEVTEGSVGETVELAGTRYTVQDVSTAQRIGNEHFGDDADGTFIIVDLEIVNTQSETKTFDQSMTKFLAADDTSYNPAQIFSEDTLFLQDMQPDLPTSGRIVFDVPPAKVDGGMLEISDLWGRGAVRVQL
jgi:hypothetical protein